MSSPFDWDSALSLKVFCYLFNIKFESDLQKHFEPLKNVSHIKLQLTYNTYKVIFSQGILSFSSYAYGCAQKKNLQIVEHTSSYLCVCLWWGGGKGCPPPAPPCDASGQVQGFSYFVITKGTV